MLSNVNLSFNADLGVYCRLWLKYLADPSQPNCALMVLAERVLIERSRGKKRRGALAQVDRLIRSIRSDRALAEAYSRVADLDRIAEKYPAYRKAGII